MLRYHPVGHCYLFDKGVEGYHNPQKEGFYYTDMLYRSWQAYGELGKVEKATGRGEAHKLFLVRDGVNRTICCPFPVSELALTLDDWEFDHPDNWSLTDKLDAKIGTNTTKRFMFSLVNTPETAASTFVVPKHGSWSVVLRRATPDKNKDINQCYSTITFGDFMLYIPYNDGMALYKENEGEWNKVKDLVLKQDNGNNNDDGSNYIVVNFLNLNGMLCFSGNWFRDFDVYRETEDVEPENYNILLHHNGSAWHFNFYTTKFEDGHFTSTRVPFPYALETDVETLEEEVAFEVAGEKKPGNTDIVVELDPEWEPDGLGVQYKCSLTAENLGEGWYATPELEGVTIKHAAEILGAVVPYRDLAHPLWGERLMQVDGDEGVDFDSSTWGCILDNEDARLSDPDDVLFLAPFRIIQLHGGYYDWNGSRVSVPMFTGVVVTPTFGSYENLKNTSPVRLANLAWLCEQIKNKGDWPIFDGWRIKDVLDMLCDKCRVHQNRRQFYAPEIEDPENPGEMIPDPSAPINQQLSKGSPDSPLWQADILQTSAWEMMKKVVDYIKYDLFFDRVGNLVCQPKVFGWDGSFQHHFFAGELSADGLEDWRSFNIASNLEATIPGEDWYNTVYVAGYAQGGGTLSTYLTDMESKYNPDSDKYIGFEKAVAVAYETIVEQSKAEEIALSIWHPYLAFPQKLSFTTYFNPFIQPNDVVKLSGSRHKIIGSTGVNVRYWRISHISHQMRMSQLPTTQVVLEFLGDETARQEILDEAVE